MLKDEIKKRLKKVTLVNLSNPWPGLQDRDNLMENKSIQIMNFNSQSTQY